MALIGISGKIESGKDTLAHMINIVCDCFRFGRPNLSREELFIQLNKHRRDVVRTRYEHHKFAGALKDIVCILTGCTREQLEDQDFKNRELPSEWNRTITDAVEFLEMKFGKAKWSLTDEEIIKWATEAGFKFTRTYRELLQELGTNVMRQHLHPDVWVLATFAKYTPHISGFPHLVKSNGEPLVEGNEYAMGVAVLPNWIITDVRFPNEAKAVKDRGGILIRINRRVTSPVGDPYTKAANVPAAHASETALDNYQDWDIVVSNNGTLTELYNKAIEIVNQFKLHINESSTENDTAAITGQSSASPDTGRTQSHVHGQDHPEVPDGHPGLPGSPSGNE